MQAVGRSETGGLGGALLFRSLDGSEKDIGAGFVGKRRETETRNLRRHSRPGFSSQSAGTIAISPAHTSTLTVYASHLLETINNVISVLTDTLNKQNRSLQRRMLPQASAFPPPFTVFLLYDEASHSCDDCRR
jgi:hypothetical protein